MSVAPISYKIEARNLHSHLFDVTLTIVNPQALQRVSLPVWIPGSYLVREFSKNLQNLSATQGRLKRPVSQLDKCTWEIACSAGKPLQLCYQIYAHDNSVRAAWLDANRGFFNGCSVCLKVQGLEAGKHALELAVPVQGSGWSVATGLTPVKTGKSGWGTYSAANYDELVDCPVEMGAFWQGSFSACGVPHRFVVAGAPASFDGARLLADTQKICEQEIRFWHGSAGVKTKPLITPPTQPPFTSYLFMLNAVDDGYGGLEHRSSTALICNRKDLPRLNDAKLPDGYTTLRGLISHEYFHTWNVKRLRPAEFASYDYGQENYTSLLWFFEGFTSYYDDLLLARAGLLDSAAYLKLLNKTINQVMQTPGARVQSVAEASLDAWVKYYRPDANTPNATVSYYTKGALVALCFDLTLRREGHTTLDDVMRALWLRCQAGPMQETDFAAVLQALGKRSFDAELKRWVHGKAELPLRALLEDHGITVHDDPAQLAHRLGLRIGEVNGVQIKNVLSGSAAEKAGFAPGDEWLAVESARPQDGWRMQRLDDLLLYAGTARKVTALVARDKRLLRLSLTIPPPATTWRLAISNAAKVDAWLAN